VGVIVVGVAVLFLQDDDEQAVTTSSTTAAPTTPTTEATSTTADPDEPGGLDPVAIDAAESISESFQATPEQEECMLDAFEEQPELFAALDEEELTDPELMIDIIGVAKDCLDPEELAGAFADGMLQGSDVELTPEQASCLSDELLSDDELLAVILVMGTDPTAEPDAATIGPLWSLFSTCDLGSALAESLQADDATLTDEQALCVADGMLALDPEIVEELLGLTGDPGAEPSPEMLGALIELFTTCEIDLPPGALESPGASSGPT
jgi:hypothetical protein